MSLLLLKLILGKKKWAIKIVGMQDLVVDGLGMLRLMKLLISEP
jgi:hypothetical protein